MSTSVIYRSLVSLVVLLTAMLGFFAPAHAMPFPPPQPPQPNPILTYHIKPGDTLWDIAHRYGTTIPRIAWKNHIHNPNLIYAGDNIKVPLGTGGATVPLFYRPANGQLRPPVEYSYVSKWYGGQYPAHNGLDFATGYGHRVHAVAAGTVVGVWYWSYSYGLHVRIKHVNGYYTTYNHLSHIYVHTGQHVDRRQVIGLSGSSGHSTGPHLHFEIWRWMSATVNPAPWIW